MNGSREYLAAAQAKFSQLEAVYVVASAEILRSRLECRGRERAQDAVRRLSRNAALSKAERSAALVLANDGPLEIAGAQLAAFVSGRRAERRRNSPSE